MSTEKHSSAEQLQLQIEHLKKTVKSPYDLIEHVIQLYGAEFEKANAHIAAQEAALKASGKLLQEQKLANDELFRIKQKVVIANRRLMATNKELTEQLGALPKITDTLREGHARVQQEFDRTPDGSTGVTFAADVLALCDFIEQYDNAAAKPAHMDAAALEAHKIQAEDTPA